ncbi:restriction endonuclease subunit S [Spirulina sp. CS-785/01]|uniref:restriction endonuclease subunit S n=1 Tax=Spirulina sp. CS-785/01 TaxID=3021716 RepID=UPI00232D6E3C|nr:restriction endonuclease subunit S [Spirulina sp. CS-785/01]MDB9312831.1 restriction endonuclease subunit S [Spirulina sp. CS-785/01]
MELTIDNGQLTTDWKTKKLGELCSIELGKTPSRKVSKYWDKERKTDNIWLSISDLPTNLHPHVEDSKEYLSDEGAAICKVVKEGTLLVSFKLTLGRLAYAGRDLYTNEAIAALKNLDDSLVVKEYLYWYLTFFDWDKAVGGDIKLKGKTLNKTKLKLLQIILPPLEEQKRIVAILDEAFEGCDRAIRNTEQNLANAREIFDSYLNGIFTKKGDDWVEKKFSDLVLLQRGHNPPKSQFINHPKTGYVRFYQIRDGHNDDYEVYVPDTPKLHKVESDDILMVAYRHIGRVYRGAQGAFNVALCKISNKNRSTLNDDYLFNIIPSKYIKGELMKRSERSLIPSMSVKHLAQLKIPVPPIDQQEEIAREISELQEETQRLEAIYQQKLEALQELKQSILHKAFTGELTNPSTSLRVNPSTKPKEKPTQKEDAA